MQHTKKKSCWSLTPVMTGPVLTIELIGTEGALRIPKRKKYKKMKKKKKKTNRLGGGGGHHELLIFCSPLSLI